MKKVFCNFLFLLSSTAVFSQKTNSRLYFTQGQSIAVTTNISTTISQQAMGQAIDFNMDATALHYFTVTNSTEENFTLHHQVQQIFFTFDGMGQKRNFDSNNEQNLNGPMGKPVKDLLDKKYDMIIDTAGNTLLTMQEKTDTVRKDNRAAMIAGMLRDVAVIALPPEQGKASFFKVLPDTVLTTGSTWIESHKTTEGFRDAAYRIAEITDSVIVVSFASSGTSTTKAEMMGNETTTNLNSNSTGKIILDRSTGIMIEKTETIESSGTTETTFGSLPVSSKTVARTSVNTGGRSVQ